MPLQVGWTDYFKRRFNKVIPAYLIIASLYYIILGMNLKEIIYNLFFLNFIFDGKRDFWYIFEIIACYLLFPLMRKLWICTNYRVSLTVMFIGSIAITIVCKYYFPILYDNCEIALWRFPCFWMGCYYGVVSFNKETKKCIVVTLIFTSAGVLSFLTSGLSRNTFTFMSPIVIFLVCNILDFIKIKGKYIDKLLTFLGKESGELYLIHVSFGVILLNIFNKSSILVFSVAIYFAFSIALASLIHGFLSRIKL